MASPESTRLLSLGDNNTETALDRILKDAKQVPEETFGWCPDQSHQVKLAEDFPVLVDRSFDAKWRDLLKISAELHMEPIILYRRQGPIDTIHGHRLETPFFEDEIPGGTTGFSLHPADGTGDYIAVVALPGILGDTHPSQSLLNFASYAFKEGPPSPDYVESFEKWCGFLGMQKVVQAPWHMYGCYLFILELQWHVVQLMIFAIFTIIGLPSARTALLATLIVRVATFTYGFFCLGRMYYCLGPDSVWNMLQLSYIFCGFATLYCDSFGFEEWRGIIATVGALSIWAYTIKLARAFEATGLFMMSMFSCLVNLTPAFTLLFAIILAFGHAVVIFVSMNGDSIGTGSAHGNDSVPDQIEHADALETLGQLRGWQVIVVMFRWAFQNAGISNVLNLESPVLLAFYIVFALLHFAFANIMITAMGKIYDKIEENGTAVRAFLRTRVETLVTQHIVFSFLFPSLIRMRGRWLIWYTRITEDPTAQDGIQQILNAVELQGNMLRGFEDRLERLEHRIEKALPIEASR